MTNLEAIKDYINERVSGDNQLKGYCDKVRKASATYKDASLFSERIGVIISDAVSHFDYQDFSWEEILQVCMDVLEYDFEVVSEFCELVQTDLNAKYGVKLKPVKATFDKANAVGIANNSSNGYLIGDQIKTYSRYTADNYQVANMKYQQASGLKPRICRELGGETCAFCRGLVYDGEYKGSGMPAMIFVRHRGCDCNVIYTPSTGRHQDVWSKKYATEYTEACKIQRDFFTEKDALTIDKVKARREK